MESKKHENIESETIEGIKPEWFDVARSSDVTEATDEEIHEMERRADAKEYLDLLMELSEDFTNMEAKSGRAMKRDKDGEAKIVGPGYFDGKARIDNLFKIAGIEDEGSDAEVDSEDPYYSENPYINSRYRLQIVDDILRSDEDLADTIEDIIYSKRKKTKAKEAKEEHIDAEQEKSFGRRLLGLMGYMKEKDRIHKKYEKFRWRERQGREHVATLQSRISRALSKAYSQKREYGKGDNDEEIKREMQHNWDIWYERFLGDEERQEKIKKAHELRSRIFVANNNTE